MQLALLSRWKAEPMLFSHSSAQNHASPSNHLLPGRPLQPPLHRPTSPLLHHRTSTSRRLKLRLPSRFVSAFPFPCPLNASSQSLIFSPLISRYRYHQHPKPHAHLNLHPNPLNLLLPNAHLHLHRLPRHALRRNRDPHPYLHLYPFPLHCHFPDAHQHVHRYSLLQHGQRRRNEPGFGNDDKLSFRYAHLYVHGLVFSLYHLRC
jgi:hypothetical protein